MGDMADLISDQAELYESYVERKMLMSTDLVIVGALLSYLNWQEARPTPSGDMKFSVSILIDKKDKVNLKAIDIAIKAAIKKGLEDNKFTKAQLKGLRMPLRDGSAEFKDGTRGKEYDGKYFLNANSNRQPGVVDENRKPIIDPDTFYSGCFGHVHVNMFPYNTAGNKGIGVGLNNLMKADDGERLDGRKSAEDAFSDYGTTDEGDTEGEEAAF